MVSAVCAALTEIAQGIILPRYRQLGEGDVRAKTSATDLVTIADEESERALAPRLMALLPGAKVVGEEAIAADPSALPGLLSHDPVWIVDPIDGTLNFVHGRDTFASVVALVSQGETVLGWIHDPLTGRTVWAEKGKGCWRRPLKAVSAPSDTRLRLPGDVTRPGVDLKSLNAALYDKKFAGAKGAFARNANQGSAAHDYWALAEGRLHISGYKNLKPWDHAAGVLIHAEAGGYGRLLSGAPYNPVVAGQTGILSAPSPDIWQRVAALTQPNP
ncbi:MAG: inositol monophosphatase [Rhodospirillaceae bacterium]|nr:inositol monophosphatase [Rhodospirillaceae bacterium]